MRRFPLAFLLVGVLGLLAAGGAVLGAFQAPAGTDLAVHDGAGATLLASDVVGSYTSSQYNGVVVSFAFHAPDHASEVAKGPSGKVAGRRHLSGSQASGVLGPVQKLLSLGGFSAHGSIYESTQPASVLVRPATRGKVSGTYRTRVQVEGGYVVAVFLRIDATEGAQHISETYTYRLSRVGPWTPRALGERVQASASDEMPRQRPSRRTR